MGRIMVVRFWFSNHNTFMILLCIICGIYSSVVLCRFFLVVVVVVAFSLQYISQNPIVVESCVVYCEFAHYFFADVACCYCNN